MARAFDGNRRARSVTDATVWRRPGVRSPIRNVLSLLAVHGGYRIGRDVRFLSGRDGKSRIQETAEGSREKGSKFLIPK